MCNKMSEVRLSNASPTLERVDARQPDNARPPVRRNLFGTSDPEETRRYFRDFNQEEQRAFAETWDFDPVAGEPLSPRNYNWEEVSDAPEYYHRPPHRRQPPPGNVDLRGDNNQQDAEERNERRPDPQPDPQPDRNGSRKRPAAASGACSSQSQSKRSHTDEEDDDDEDQATGSGNQSVSA